jgi:hypothetical protein
MMPSGLESPEGVWWKPVHRSERVWFGIAFAFPTHGGINALLGLLRRI